MIVIATRGEKVDVWVNVDLVVGQRIFPHRMIKQERGLPGGVIGEVEEPISHGHTLAMFDDELAGEALEHLARLTGRARALRWLLLPMLKEPKKALAFAMREENRIGD